MSDNSSWTITQKFTREKVIEERKRFDFFQEEIHIK